MASNSIARAAVLMLVIVLAATVCWETHLRQKGIPISYDNMEPLWSNKRAMVYEPSDKATVFIGSSRIKYDLDIPLWEKTTGNHAIQLAVEGSNLRPVLENLADDKNFKGTLVIDVTEGLFFGSKKGMSAERSYKMIKYYKEETPAQKAGFIINHALESQLVFLDKEDLSMTPQLDQLVTIPNRKGVMSMPYFPVEFTRIHFNRQSFMTENLLKDTNLQKRVTDMWMMYANMSKGFPPASGDTLLQIIKEVKVSTDKIIARGGKVLFVRTPSSGPALMGEKMGFPREKYWNKLLEITGCPGIHFADYPAIDHFICPEWSHLSPADALVFTTEFIRILKQEQGWKFPSANTN